MTICTSEECTKCKYGTKYSVDKARVYVRCECHKKSILFGKRIECSFYEERKNDGSEDQKIN